MPGNYEPSEGEGRRFSEVKERWGGVDFVNGLLTKSSIIPDRELIVIRIRIPWNFFLS